MKKKLLFALCMAALLVCVLAISISAAAPVPTKPDLGVYFGETLTIDGFTAPSDLYVGTTERVLLVDENGNYATYPTYYVTKDNTTFDFDFSKLNGAQSIQYTKKSVVMVEIPTGVTTISNSYFAGTGNFPACLSVQIPGTVTSFGSSLFSTNSVIRIVECLDGTEPVTIGNAMFGSAWNGGATNIQYVKFPNNLVSIGNNTFGKAYASKTIILGANLKSIGTGFFGEATPEAKDTFIYVSDNFFAETEVFANLFGGFGQYHNNHLKLTVFYTGSQAKLQSLIDRCLEIQPKDYIWNNKTVVSASEYDYETHKPKSRLSATLVYDFGKCDAFYGGHSFKGEEQVLLNNYFESYGVGDSCANCGISEIKETYGALFTYLGYSCTEAPIGGTCSMSQFYGINEESIDVYEKLTGNEVVYGFVIASVENPFTSEYVDTNKVIVTPAAKLTMNYADVKVSGITEETAERGVVFCMYVNDGGNIFYLDNGTTSKTVGLKSYNDVLEIKKNEEVA